jgi:hypothetical protein
MIHSKDKTHLVLMENPILVDFLVQSVALQSAAISQRRQCILCKCTTEPSLSIFHEKLCSWPLHHYFMLHCHPYTWRDSGYTPFIETLIFTQTSTARVHHISYHHRWPTTTAAILSKSQCLLRVSRLGISILPTYRLRHVNRIKT